MRHVWVVVAILLFVGCDDGDDGSSDGVADAAPVFDAAPVIPDAAPPPDAPPPCHTAANLGTTVAQVAVAEIAPVPLGGDLVPGTYVVTDNKAYTGMGGMTGLTGTSFAATSVSGATSFDYIETSPGNELVLSGTYMTNGTGITITVACPTSSAGVSPYDQYTATADSFTLYDDTTFAGATFAVTYTKQP